MTRQELRSSFEASVDMLRGDPNEPTTAYIFHDDYDFAYYRSNDGCEAGPFMTDEDARYDATKLGHTIIDEEEAAY